MGSRVGAFADLNGDRHLDIVLNHGAELIILLNQGNGQFRTRGWLPFDLEMPAYAVVVFDVNRDNNPDLVVPTCRSHLPYKSRVALLLGDGRGFTPAAGSPFPAARRLQPGRGGRQRGWEARRGRIELSRGTA